MSISSRTGAARDATESIELLLQSLEQLEHSYKDRSKAEDLEFLRGMLRAPEFHSLLNAHNTVQNSTDEHAPEPVVRNAVMLTNMVLYDAEGGHTSQEKELSELLTNPHIAAILSAHDRISNKDYPLRSVATSGLGIGAKEGQDVNGFPNPVRVVHMEKKDKPLGATVRSNPDQQIVISRVLHGGMASRSGMLHQGDTVLEINGQSVQGWSIDQVANYMDTVCVKCLLDYVPVEDKLHPCPEVGLELQTGMILHVLDQEDSDWWQAVVDGEDMSQVGLIPSKKHLEYVNSCFKGSYSQRKQSKSIMYENQAAGATRLGVEIRSYEEVVKIVPPDRRPRPIVLIAPRRGPFTLLALRDNLVSQDPNTFGLPIQHTSREPRSDERNGHHYHFVSVPHMEREIMRGQMVEHGIVRGSYYGTSVSAIRDVADYEKTCLLVVDPQTIRNVRTADIQPFIVYFKPPSDTEMKATWVEDNIIKESDMADIIRQATYLERNFGHFFDFTAAMDNFNSAFKLIRNLARLLRTNEQWVPVSWLE